MLYVAHLDDESLWPRGGIQATYKVWQLQQSGRHGRIGRYRITRYRAPNWIADPASRLQLGAAKFISTLHLLKRIGDTYTRPQDLDNNVEK
jgi:hypothetical protein